MMFGLIIYIVVCALIWITIGISIYDAARSYKAMEDGTEDILSE